MSFVVQVLAFCILHLGVISGYTDFGDQLLTHNDSTAETSEVPSAGSGSVKSEVPTAGYDWKLPKRGSRGFDDYFNERFSNSMDGGNNNGWSPYTLSGQRDMYDSDSTVNWNAVQKKDINRQTTSSDDFQIPPFGSDNADMMMMMQIMKKMDNASPKPGLLTRILDNPTTLVMATFIPFSLLIAAALPVFTNIMMNGLTIPPILPKPSGKPRNVQEEDTTIEFHAPILRNLMEFGSRYFDNPECLHRIFCEMATGNGTEQNYLRRAFDTATFIANDKLLENFGIKSFVKTIKSGKCELLPCESMTEKTKLNLKDLMNDIMFKHSMSMRPNKTR